MNKPTLKNPTFVIGKSSGSVAIIKRVRLPKKTYQKTGKNKASPSVNEEDNLIMQDSVCLLGNA